EERRPTSEGERSEKTEVTEHGGDTVVDARLETETEPVSLPKVCAEARRWRCSCGWRVRRRGGQRLERRRAQEVRRWCWKAQGGCAVVRDTQRQRRCCRRWSGAVMPWMLARWSGAATGDDGAVVVGTPARGRRRTLFASDGGQEFKTLS
ncbi:hypothetical protein U1Q18_049536, partial [Sarracenia purpurea var. burkii]